MYEELPLEALLPSQSNPNKISRMFSKKLLHNIGQIGQYETVTVRPHPKENGKFEVLNGHARLEVLRKLGVSNAKCDIWDVSDSHALLFLAILNRLRGSDVPEIRMQLLLGLLNEMPKDALAAHIPETENHLTKLERLHEGQEALETVEEDADFLGTVIMSLYLTKEQHEIITVAIDAIMQELKLSNSSEAITKMAEICIETIHCET